MTNTGHISRIKVLATLTTLPVLIWLAASLFLFAAPVIWEFDPKDSRYYRVFGDALVPIIMVGAAMGAASFIQMYRWRNAYLRHDTNTLYRGWWNKWPITNLSDVYIVTNWLGIRSLRAQIGSRDIELFKAYFVIEDIEAVLAKLQALQKQ